MGKYSADSSLVEVSEEKPFSASILCRPVERENNQLRVHINYVPDLEDGQEEEFLVKLKNLETSGGMEEVIAEFEVVVFNQFGRYGIEPKNAPEEPAVFMAPATIGVTFAKPGTPIQSLSWTQGLDNSDELEIFWIALPVSDQELQTWEYKLGLQVERSGQVVKDDTTTPAKVVLQDGAELFPKLLESDGLVGSMLEADLMHEVVQQSVQDKLVAPSIQEMYFRAEKQREKAFKAYAKWVDDYVNNVPSLYAEYVKDVKQHQRIIASITRLEKLASKESPSYADKANQQIYSYMAELEEINTRITQYLDVDKGIPSAYKEGAKRKQAHLQKCKEIDEFMNTPIVKLVCILPGGGCLMGIAEILKGNLGRGLVNIGFDLLTFGGFAKLGSLRRIYRGSHNPQRLGAIFKYRYMEVVRYHNMTGVKAIAVLSGTLDKDVEKVINLGISWKSAYGAIKDISLLYNNGKKIAETLRNASKESYLSWANAVSKDNDMLFFWSQIRAGIKSYQGAESSLKFVNQLLDDIQYKDALKKGEILRTDLPPQVQDRMQNVRAFQDVLNEEDFSFEKFSSYLLNEFDPGVGDLDSWMEKEYKSREKDAVKYKAQISQDRAYFERELESVKAAWERDEADFGKYWKGPGKREYNETEARTNWAREKAKKLFRGDDSLEAVILNYLSVLTGLGYISQVTGFDDPHKSFSNYFLLCFEYVTFERKYYSMFRKSNYQKDREFIQILRKLNWTGFESDVYRMLDNIFGVEYE